MQRISMANVLDIFKTNFGLSLRNNLLLAICYLLLIPIIRGTANLDAVRSAECLEQSVTLIGIFLIVPLNAPEQSKAIQEIIGTKKLPQWLILFVRLIMALVTLVILTSIFAGIMKGNNCTFPVIPYVTGTIISELALGSVGFFISVLSNSVIAGYLTAMGYFLFNFLGDISSKSIFYLFSMGTGNYIVKLWLTLFSVLLIVISLIYEKKKTY
ncbi:MAG: hypothetical protein ACI4F2_08310 [Acutalibacteraceae bacterium]